MAGRPEAGGRRGVSALGVAGLIGAAACALALAAGTSPGQEGAGGSKGRADDRPKAKAGAAGKAAARLKKGAEIARDLRRKAEGLEIREAFLDLQSAANRQRAGAIAVPARPAKVVESPGLTSADIDRMIDEGIAAEGGTAAGLTDDATFLRRAMLDATGKTPSAERVEAFAADRDPEKRAKLIDELLASRDFARHQARYWRDVIASRATNAQPIQTRWDVLENWLAEAFEEGRTWDEIAGELITGSGITDESGPANFAMAHEGEPAEFAGEVSRVFLGLQIACAQCHDHPYDPWKREQFHEFAAFLGGVERRLVGGDGYLRRFRIVDKANPRYRMPDLDDPSRSEPVAPRFGLLRADEPAVDDRLPSEERRALLASYVTGQDNPWFAKAFANRVWGTLMGEAFRDPVDDLGPTRDSAHEELFSALSEAWGRGGYDPRWLYRTIMNTRAYQRESMESGGTGRAPGGPFAANQPRRLRGDAIWDSLARVLGIPADGSGIPGGPGMGGRRPGLASGPGGGGGAAAAMALGSNPDAAERLAARRPGLPIPPRAMVNSVFKLDPSTPDEEVAGTIPQALALMNSKGLHDAISARNRNTTLSRILNGTRDDAKAVRQLYLHALGREPNAEETAICLEHARETGDRGEAFEDILWSLVNSTEFLNRR